MKLKIAIAALAGATLFSIAPAGAQYYDPYGRPPPRWERPYYGGGGYYRPPMGRVCETSRGSCRTRPAPIGAGCGCYIPGFGPKRGNIAY
jgi:hypothetical protein